MSGHFSQLALNFFLEDPISFNVLLIKMYQGVFLVDAASCNGNCMCSTSCIKSLKNSNNLEKKLEAIRKEICAIH